MIERLGLRLDAADQRHLVAIAAAMNATKAPDALPWQRGATISQAVRLALAVAADALDQGKAGAFLAGAANGTAKGA